MTWRSLLVAALLATVPSLAAAQGHQKTSAEIVAEVKRLLLSLRAAAEQRDWETVSHVLPPAGALRERIHAVVAGLPEGGGLSFWSPLAKPDFTALQVVAFASDLAAIAIPFTQEGSAGTYGAVFDKAGGHWRMRCFQEAFPEQPPQPGCAFTISVF